MATNVLTNAAVYLGDTKLHNRANSVALEYSAEAVDVTTLGDTTRVHTGGIKLARAVIAGFTDDTAATDEANPGATWFSATGSNTALDSFTAAAEGGTEGNTAYGFRVTHVNYSPIQGGSIGAAQAFSIELESDKSPLVRGILEANRAAAAASSNTTGRQLGAVSATQTLYGGLHVTAASAADTLDVLIESDSTSGFSTPTTQITFTQATATTSQWSTVAGAITDTWFRVNFIIAGTAPSFDFHVFMGIA